MKSVFWYLVLLFMFSSLYLTDQFNSIGNVAISVVILMIIPLIMVVRKDDFKIRLYSFLNFYAFLFFCALSALYNTDYNLLLGTTVIFMLYVSAMIVVPSFKGININETIFKAVLVSHIPLLVIPIMVSGFNSSPYKGIFYSIICAHKRDTCHLCRA